MATNDYLFTSESVSEGHPDKVSDRISDAVVDAYLAADPLSRVACETLTTTNRIVLAGEIRGPEDLHTSGMEDVARQAENAPWGTPEEVTERIIETAEHAGAHTVQISLNRGAMPHEMFIEQIRLFADKVLPAVQAHNITSVPLAEAAA